MVYITWNRVSETEFDKTWQGYLKKKRFIHAHVTANLGQIFVKLSLHLHMVS